MQVFRVDVGIGPYKEECHFFMPFFVDTLGGFGIMDG